MPDIINGLFAPIYTEEVTLSVYLLCFLVSLFCGALIALATSFRARLSRSFLLSVFLIPAVVQTVIMLVNGSIGTGLAVMSAFSLIRFRSAPGTAKEIVAIFAAMAAGLACATGYIFLAVIFSVIVTVILLIAAVVRLPENDDLSRELRITVPESLNYAHEFDDLFEQYTASHKLTTVKTTNMGSLYKLVYDIRLKSEDCIQPFIDDLRCRNGNLEIAIALPSTTKNEL